MLPATALGEILIVGAVPTAVVIAIAAALLSRRQKRLARVLMGLAVVVPAGMIVAGRQLSEPLDEVRRSQLERFAPLETGWTKSEVSEALGEPDLVCPGEGAHVHKVRGTPQLLARLYAATTERWIYFAPGAPAAPRTDCRPRFADGEVAFNGAGRVIWFIELTDETFLKF